jgi:guanylate kinase
MSHWLEYQYVIINDDLEVSVAQAEAIIVAERLKRSRQIGLADFVTRLRGG